MTKNTKLAIGVISSLFLLCFCSVLMGYLAIRSVRNKLEGAVSFDPTEVAALADKIVDYDVPPDYYEHVGMSFLGFNLVALASDIDDKAIIILMQFPPNGNLSQADMEAQAKQATQRRWSSTVELKVVDHVTQTIRGQEIRLTISEGKDEQGQLIRQMTGVFKGRRDLVMLMVIGTAKKWDEDKLTAFIASIH